MKLCNDCAEEFQPKRPWQQYCSEQCQARAANRRSYLRNGISIRKRSQEWYQENKNAVRKRVRKNHAIREGYDPEEAERMRETIHQCQVCGSSRKLYLDHDHAGGAIRGILCAACNWILGAAHDDTQRLQKLIGYLERSKSKRSSYSKASSPA